MWRASHQKHATILAALAAASVVATTVTTVIVSVVASVEDLIWIFEMRDATPELQAIFGYNFEESLRSWASEFLLGFVAGPVWGFLLGFLGAFAFLTVGFALVPHRRKRPRIYALTGAMVGLVHSTVGIALHLADQRIGPRSDWESVIHWLSLWGGFFLTSSPRLSVVVATFPASAIAGAFAGLLYARIAEKTHGAVVET